MEDLLAFRPIGLAIPSDVSTLPAAVACHPRAWLLTETLDEESNVISAIDCSERLDRFSDRISTSVGHPWHIFLIVELVSRLLERLKVDFVSHTGQNLRAIIARNMHPLDCHKGDHARTALQLAVVAL